MGIDQKLNQVSLLQNKINSDRNRQVALISQVVVESIKTNHPSGILQTIGLVAGSDIKAEDLLKEIQDIVRAAKQGTG